MAFFGCAVQWSFSSGGQAVGVDAEREKNANEGRVAWEGSHGQTISKKADG